jgi:hypothetical protein
MNNPIKRSLTFLRFVTLAFVGLALAGCIALLYGKVSTAIYTQPPSQPQFIVVAPSTRNLTDQDINLLLEAKMVERGYAKAASREVANVAVLYRYSLARPCTEVSSSPDFDWREHNAEPGYPCFLEVLVLYIEKSKPPEKFEIIWQGVAYAFAINPDLRNIYSLSKDCVDKLFEHYGTAVTNKKFTVTFHY